MEEKKENLLVRLCKRIKAMFNNSKVVRRVATLAIASALSLTVMFGCAPNNTVKPGPGTDPTEPTTKYSAILEDVLDDEYYNSLIDNAKEDFELYDSASFDPHPYAFLKKEGHDIDAVKSGELECRTVSYVLENEPNNLYMMTYVENKSSDPYYTEYTLKYTLSEQEMKDYKFLHKDGSDYYIQAVFMNDAISKNKRETIVSETKMNVKAHKEMCENLASLTPIRELVKTNNIDIILMEFNKSNETFTFCFRSNVYSTTNMMASKNFVIANCSEGASTMKVNNNIFYGPTKYLSYLYTDDIDGLIAQSANFFDSQNTWLNGINCKDLEV